jgi:hypothetical protein
VSLYTYDAKTLLGDARMTKYLRWRDILVMLGVGGGIVAGVAIRQGSMSLTEVGVTIAIALGVWMVGVGILTIAANVGRPRR